MCVVDIDLCKMQVMPCYGWIITSHEVLQGKIIPFNRYSITMVHLRW